MTYLQTRETYEEWYDSATVDYCRIEEERALYMNRHKSEKVAQEFAKQAVLHEMLERYERKKEHVDARMKRDREFDEMLEKLTPPEDVYCKKCNKKMKLVSRQFHFCFKTQEWDTDVPLFRFSCNPGCVDIRPVHIDGTDLPEQSLACPECGSDIDMTCSISENNTELCVYNCASCGYEDVDETDLQEEEDQNLEADMKRFCITDEQAAILKKVIGDKGKYT
jgi:hypothetical protein